MSIGDSSICTWRDDKAAAFSICADDSLLSQADLLIPEMLKRGISGTFFVNPGLGAADGFHCWDNRREVWLRAARSGCDFGNHSMYHASVRDVQEAENDVREACRVLREFNPAQGRLLLFSLPGGVHWEVTPVQLQELLARYDCVAGRGGGTAHPVWFDTGNGALRGAGRSATAEQLRSYVDAALADGGWHYVSCHGVGPRGEWIVLDAEALLALLDHLVALRQRLWVTTSTRIHKYERQRSRTSLQVAHARDERICVRLVWGCPPTLYDEPLTLRTVVPAQWSRCLVTQGGACVGVAVRDGAALYAVVPGGGEVVLTPQN